MKKYLFVISIALSLIHTESAQAGSYDDSYCREFTQNLTVGSGPQSGYGTACLQPDGSWRIVSTSAMPMAAPVVVTPPPVQYVEVERNYYYPRRPYVSYRPIIERHVYSRPYREWRHHGHHRRHGYHDYHGYHGRW